MMTKEYIKLRAVRHAILAPRIRQLKTIIPVYLLKIKVLGPKEVSYYDRTTKLR